MDNKKSLTIGITINLDNYENLRLELEGDICNDQDAGTLISDLDSILSGLGRGDEVTAERIDSYRRRVFTKYGKQGKQEKVEKNLSIMEKKAERCESEGSRGMKLPENTIARKERESSGNKGSLFSYDDKIVAGTAKERENLQGIPKEEGTGGPGIKHDLTCESCGSAISEKQRKISQMFTDRNLCEKCIQAEQGMK